MATFLTVLIVLCVHVLCSATSALGNDSTIPATSLVDTATPETTLADTAIHETTMADTATHVTPLADTATHVTPLADTATHVTPLADTATHVTPLADTATHVTPLADTATHVTPLADTATHVTPLADTATHVTPLADTATHVTPLADTATHVTPLADTATHVTPLADTATHVTPLADTATHVTPLADTATHVTPLTDTATHVTPLTDTATHVTPLADTATHVIIPLVDSATLETTLVDSATRESPLVDTATPAITLFDTPTHETQLVDTATHESPLGDTATHETQLVDTATHETQLVGTATHESPLDDTATHETQSVGTATHEFQLDDTATHETSLADPLKNLIAKQIVLCGYNSLCTFQNPTKPSTHLACCGTCSCNSDCLTNNTCCVDYVLKLVYGNVTFGSINDVNVALTNNTTKLQIERLIGEIYMSNDSETQYNSTDLGDVIKCMSPQLTATDKGVRSKPGQYYELVTGCRKNALHPSYSCLKTLEPEGFFDSIPVTSITRGNTYKTRSLYDCCGNTNETYEYWDMFLECYQLSVFNGVSPIHLPSPFALLHGKVLRERCKVVFEPNENMKNRGFVKECLNVDINTCAIKPISKEALFLKNFCEMENHNVKLTDETTSKIYNNAACVLCNNENYTRMTECHRDSDSDDTMKLRVNLEGIRSSLSASEEMSKNDVLNTRALSIFSGYLKGCSRGHIYVPMLEECKKVYCPRNMIIVNGSCVPLYDRVSGASYKTTFNMTIISPASKEVKQSSFERAFISFLNEEHFIAASLTIERVRMINQGVTYMVEMLLSPNKTSNVTMSSVVEAVTSWYFTTIDVHVSDATLFQMGISPGNMRYINDTQNKPDGTNSTLIRVVKPPRNSRYLIKNVIVISEAYACHRIGIKFRLFEGLTTDIITLPGTDLYIIKNDVDYIGGRGHLLVCAYLVLNGPRYFHVTRKSLENTDVIKRFYGKTSTPIVDDEKPMHVLLIVIIGAAGVVMCIVGRLIAEKASVCLTRIRGNEGN